MRFLLFIIFISTGFSIIGQNLLYNSTLTYQTENEISLGILEKKDSFFISTGSIYAPQYFSNLPFIIKLNDNGDVVWKTFLGRIKPNFKFISYYLQFDEQYVYASFLETDESKKEYNLNSFIVKIDLKSGDIITSYQPYFGNDQYSIIRSLSVHNDSLILTGTNYNKVEASGNIGIEWIQTLDKDLILRDAAYNKDSISFEINIIQAAHHTLFNETIIIWSLEQKELGSSKFGIKRINKDTVIQFEYSPTSLINSIFGIKPVSDGYVIFEGDRYTYYNIFENTFKTYTYFAESIFGYGRQFSKDNFHTLNIVNNVLRENFIDLENNLIEKLKYKPLVSNEKYNHSYYDAENDEIYILGSNSDKSFFIKRIPRDSSNACVDREIEKESLFVDEYPIELLPDSTEFIPYEGGKNLNITALDFPEHQFEKVLTCSEDLQPKIDFTVSDSLLYKNQHAYFTAEFQNPPDSVYWVFQNGFPATSISLQPDSIYYPIEGCHRVSLYASNQYGDDELVKDCYIYVAPSVGVSDQNNPVKVFPTLISPRQPITIEHSGDIQSVQVYNTQGTLVSSFLEEINTNTYSMQIQQFIPGVYFLQIIFEDGRKENRKVVVTD